MGILRGIKLNDAYKMHSVWHRVSSQYMLVINIIITLSSTLSTLEHSVLSSQSYF